MVPFPKATEQSIFSPPQTGKDRAAYELEQTEKYLKRFLISSGIAIGAGLVNPLAGIGILTESIRQLTMMYKHMKAHVQTQQENFAHLSKSKATASETTPNSSNSK